jgi:hypothetical protein
MKNKSLGLTGVAKTLTKTCPSFGSGIGIYLT